MGQQAHQFLCFDFGFWIAIEEELCYNESVQKIKLYQGFEVVLAGGF